MLRGFGAALLAAVAAIAVGASAAHAADHEVWDERGPVRASFLWSDGPDFGWTDLWVTVTRDGEVVHDEPVDVPGCEDYACGPMSQRSTLDDRPSIQLAHLDGDREPEVVTGIFTSTGFCCEVTQVLRWRGDHYAVATHSFEMASFRLADLDRDGRREFSSRDSRFRYAFSSGAGSWNPPQVWAFADGRFRDVTRRHPSLARRDARAAMRAYQRVLRSRYPNSGAGVLAAWVADQRLLGNRKAADRFLARERRAGRLDGLPGYRSSGAYLRALRVKLARWGY